MFLWQELQPADWQLLLQGFAATLEVTFWTLCISLPLGAVLGCVRFLDIPYLAKPVGILLDSVRAIPLVLFMVIAFLILPFAPKFLAVAALCIYTVGSLADIVRGGLLSVSVSQFQAAQILGLTTIHQMRYIAFPQAFRRMLPSIVNQVSVVIKDTTLVSLGVMELTKAVNILNMRHLDLSASCMILVAGTYFLLCFGFSRLGLWLEAKLAVSKH